jgi:hypothetical protein
MTTSRVRTTVTVRSDNPVPRRRSKKKESSVVLVVALIIIGALPVSRSNRPRAATAKTFGSPVGHDRAS